MVDHGHDDPRTSSVERRLIIWPWSRQPLAEVRVTGRHLLPPSDDGGWDTLRWEVGETRPSEPLDDVLAEFVALADADATTIAAFAARFGPLHWFGSDHPAREVTPTPDGESADVHEEPLGDWRRVARGVGALVTLDLATRPGAPQTSRWHSGDAIEWPIAIATAASIAAFLKRGTGLTSSSPASLAEVGMKITLGGSGTSVEDQRLYLDRVLDGILRDIGVETVTVRNERGERDLAYAVPRTRITPSSDARTPPHWQVTSLLPVIALALVDGLDPMVWALCTRCGKPAKKREGGRGPRQNGTESYAWYGDHEACRTWARTETLIVAENRRAEKRRAEKRKAAGAHSHRDRQVDGPEEGSVD